MDKHRYLRIDSCHPKHCKASFSFSQVLQLVHVHVRICSEDCVYEQRTCELKHHFLSWGYHKQHVDNELERALEAPREPCL